MIVVTVSYVKDRFRSTEDTYTHNSGANTFLMVVVWIFSVPTILLMILDFNLVALHLLLIKKKMTTFDYIMYVRDKKELEESLVIH